MEHFHFIRPWWFIALIPALLFWLSLWRSRARQGGWRQIIPAHLLPYLIVKQAQVKNSGNENRIFTVKNYTLTGLGLAWLISIIALAGPAWRQLPQPVMQQTDALVIVLDLSLSMNANDLSPSRLHRAKYKIEDILKQRQEGFTALVVYAGDAHTVTPLTDDTATIESMLSVLTSDIMPVPGSEPQTALQLAIDLLKQSQLAQGRILWISDGLEPGQISSIAELFHSTPYDLCMMSVGSVQGAPIPLPNGTFIKDSRGAIVMSKPDPALFKNLASQTGGRYSALRADDSDLSYLLPPVRQERIDRAQQQLDQWQEEGPWLVLLLVPLLALAFRRGVVVMVVGMVLWLGSHSQAHAAGVWEDLWLTKPQQGQKAFEQGDYGQAQTLFQDPARKGAAAWRQEDYAKAHEFFSQAPQNADDFYNLGNSFAGLQKFEEALLAYQKALELDAGHEDAQFNKELMEKLLRQQQQQSQQQQSQQQPSQQQESQQQQQDSQQQQQAQSQQFQQNRQQKSDEENHEKKDDENNKNKKYDKEENNDDKNDEEKENNTESQAQNTSQQQKKSERDQAVERWLNQAPDDPGGLLRRKFLLQSQERNQKAPPGEKYW